MKTFTDKKDRVWKINLTLGAAKRVFDATGFNLLDPTSNTEMEVPIAVRLLLDDLFFGKVIAELIKPQCAANNVKESEIYDVFDAETLKKAQDAFQEEYSSFFEQRGNVAFAKTIEAAEEFKNETMRKIEDGTITAKQIFGQILSDLQAEQASATGANAPGESLTTTP